MKEYLYVLTPTRSGMVTDGPADREAEIVSRHFVALIANSYRGPSADEDEDE